VAKHIFPRVDEQAKALRNAETLPYLIPSGKSAPLLSFCQALAEGVLVRSSFFENGDKPV
jgi:hypothetical protein